MKVMKIDYDIHRFSKEKLDTWGAYGILAYENSDWFVIGTAGHSWSRHDLTRGFADKDLPKLLGNLSLESIDRKIGKKFNSHQWVIGIETGLEYKFDESFAVVPYVGFEYLWDTTDGYIENIDEWGGLKAASGTMVVDKYTLKVNKNNYDTGILKAGVILEKVFPKWVLACDLAWTYYSSRYRPITGKHIDAEERGEDIYFKSESLNMGKNLGAIDITVDYAITPAFMVGVEYAIYHRKNVLGQLAGISATYKF